jgi:ABC-type transport system substrate-binding protein/ABC-type dipeptide/oligopeptide/nickel transport system permease component
MARIIAAAFRCAVVVCCLLLPAGTAVEAAGDAGGALAVGLQLEPPVLDPTVNASASIGTVVFPTIFEGLVRIGPDWRIEPALATAWTVADDGRTYVFHLRPHVRFGDGAPLDAAAVRFSLRRAVAPGSLNPQHALLAGIDGVRALDPLTVAVHLRRPDYTLLQILGLSAAVIVSPRSAATNAVRPVGTGPFRFVEWRRGEAIELARNAAYWGAPPRLARVTFKVIADPNAAIDAVMTGDVDAYPAFPAPESVSRFERDPRFTVATVMSEAKTIVAINNRRAPLSDRRVRQALSYAIDRRAIIAAAMFGFGVPIGSHYTPRDPGYVDLTGEYPYDPARARALLARAGYPHGFSTTLAVPPLSYAERTAEVVAAELAQAGVRVKLVAFDWVPWLTQVFGAHDFDLTIVAHVEPLDYDIYGRDDYYFGYSNPRYKALLARLELTGDPAARRALLGAIQRTLADDAVNLFLFQYPDITIANANVHDIRPSSPLSTIDVTTAWLGTGGGSQSARAELPAGTAYALAALLGGAFVLLLIRAGWSYVAQRALSLALTLALASLAIFAVMQAVPGDPARAVLGIHADAAAIAALRTQMGLDGPFLARYLTWVGGLLHGQFGTSWTYHEAVGELIRERFALSFPLTLYALTLSTGFALALGVGAVRWRHATFGRALAAFSHVGLAIPSFWFGLLLVIPFGIGLHWFSAGGFPGWSAGSLAVLRALTLPAVALALPQAAVFARVLQFELLELADADFLRTARAKGLNETAILMRHALPNALIPMLTILALQFSFLLAGGILIENVFFLPGLGRLAFQAITNRDATVVQSVAIVLVAEVIVVSLLADLLAAAIDPRRRAATAP